MPIDHFGPCSLLPSKFKWYHKGRYDYFRVIFWRNNGTIGDVQYKREYLKGSLNKWKGQILIAEIEGRLKNELLWKISVISHQIRLTRPCKVRTSEIEQRQNQQNECASSELSDQPGHPPSLIRVFAVRMKKAWVLSYPLSAQRRLWSDWADAQAVVNFRWAHTHFVGFVMSRLK